jgi:NAD(P)-dependent dehydrogenase (short-subunit alcohol dehydrogenase family)
MDFKGKRVLITGSTMGIGRTAAEMFLAAGASVAINGRSPAVVRDVIKQLGTERLVAAAADLSTVEGCQICVDTALEGLGGLDCLVNNTGVCPLAKMMEVTEEHWDHVMNVNLQSAMFCTIAALPALRKSRGSVVMVASIAGLVAGPSESFVYAISKSGMIGMTKTLALELADDAVRVNALCPGYIDTPMVQAENQATGGQVSEYINRSTPLKRAGSTRECASSILYLASEDAGYCSGTILVNDGGCVANACWGTNLNN